MASYYTPQAAPNGGGGAYGPGVARQLITATAILSLSTAMIDNANDDFGLFYLPAGAVIVGATISATDMDTNVSPALTFDVGDSSDENRIFAASTVGQDGSLSTAMARTAHLYKYSSRTEIRAYVETAAATGAAGTLTVSVTYFVNPEFSTSGVTPTT